MDNAFSEYTKLDIFIQPYITKIKHLENELATTRQKLQDALLSRDHFVTSLGDIYKIDSVFERECFGIVLRGKCNEHTYFDIHVEEPSITPLGNLLISRY